MFHHLLLGDISWAWYGNCGGGVVCNVIEWLLVVLSTLVAEWLLLATLVAEWLLLVTLVAEWLLLAT